MNNTHPVHTHAPQRVLETVVMAVDLSSETSAENYFENCNPQ
jgi:hypothetical protein